MLRNKNLFQITKNISHRLNIRKLFSELNKNTLPHTHQSRQADNIDDINQVKNITEFKEGLILINEGKFEQAEGHLKECLKIFKNINQTETFSYIYVMNKYIQTLFYQRKLEECERTLKASIELSKEIFKSKQELTFPYYRNLIAFYTYTDISKASVLIDDLSQENEITHHKKYFSFAGGAIKLLNNEYTSAREYMNTTMGYSDLPEEFQAFNMHNMALLNSEMNRDCDRVETEDARTKWRRDFDFPDSAIAEKESFFLYKQALAKFELVGIKENQNEKEDRILTQFLYSQNEIPENLSEQDEETLVNSFKNNNSGLTMTNIAEMFFEKGKDKEKQTAFWLKTGIKHYETYEKENIARHLIIFALFYSQLGQTMYAEGLYRKAIELLKNVVNKF